jgi:hypothetical protein
VPDPGATLQEQAVPTGAFFDMIHEARSAQEIQDIMQRDAPHVAFPTPSPLLGGSIAGGDVQLDAERWVQRIRRWESCAHVEEHKERLRDTCPHQYNTRGCRERRELACDRLRRPRAEQAEVDRYAGWLRALPRCPRQPCNCLRPHTKEQQIRVCYASLWPGSCVL